MTEAGFISDATTLRPHFGHSREACVSPVQTKRKLVMRTSKVAPTKGP